MAKKSSKKIRQDNTISPNPGEPTVNQSKDLPEDVSKNDSVADSFEELSEYEVFAGDQDFYKLLPDSRSLTVPRTADGYKSLLRLARYKPFSGLQKALIAGIFTVTAIMFYAIFGPNSNTGTSLKPASAVQTQTELYQESVLRPPSTDANLAEQAENSIPLPALEQPLSLEVARTIYLQKNYDQAYLIYNQLYQALPVSEEIQRNFLQLQMAFCAENNNDPEKASQLLAVVCESSSPILRIIANYRLSLIEIQRKRYLNARTKAYKALALIKVVDLDDDWALAFECDCYFLVAECLTRNILSLGNAEDGLPADLWGKQTASANPFINLSETQLQSLLTCGSEHLSKGLLSPEIRDTKDQGILPRFSVVSYRAPIEEILAKFAARVNLDIYWSSESTGGLDSITQIIRQSPVSLYLPAANSQQITLIAAGCAGLLAHWEETPGETRVTIYNPEYYSSLNEHLSLLSRHTISLWRKFVFTFHSDQRLSNAHFAMGLLQSLTEQPTEAIAEYKLVANRFSQSSIAPYALLHSSKLKADLRDYSGARADLKQLIEQYPDTLIYGQAYLSLADVTKQVGINTEASQLYSRLYNFSLSAELKAASALGAAECYYRSEAYQEATLWLNRYIGLDGKANNSDLYLAYFLLGKSYEAMEKFEQACDAFQHALIEQNSREQYIEAIQSLVQGHIEQENFVDALNVLENARLIALSEEQSVELLLLKSTIYRILGLIDTAVDLLDDRVEYVTSMQLKTRILFELAKCYIANGDIELAQQNLSEVLRTTEPGPLAQQAAIELADVCLRLGQNSQSVSVCLQLLDSDIPDPTKNDALNILAEAYTQQQDYNKAALALTGQWK